MKIAKYFFLNGELGLGEGSRRSKHPALQKHKIPKFFLGEVGILAFLDPEPQE
jgi:hypothetical protein